MSRRIKARTRAEIGRANRDKGIRAERDVGRYLRVHGWPEAERKSDNGWRSSDRESADLGDIRGTPRLVWQVKARSDLSTLDITRILAQATEQAVAAGADYGMVVQRRDGKSDPGTWWVWLPVGDLASLVAAGHENWPAVLDRALQAPARLELADLVPLLHAAGYGEAEAA
ncbi:hypothetical protein [Saccharopolyspora phatthalungensis]|uniref:Holliday junction resolvase n=1 Tax=Saccharopolyspora phatthalungensis TaxID=664693 RepID=A0A840Q4T1_9PSEU|nr:hypothetical protein [Saccharopolyspora phatthalungensis]MBB5154987.1 hypothetical protein [Saccharopolyspora phatthalungensis]